MFASVLTGMAERSVVQIDERWCRSITRAFLRIATVVRPQDQRLSSCALEPFGILLTIFGNMNGNAAMQRVEKSELNEDAERQRHLVWRLRGGKWLKRGLTNENVHVASVWLIKLIIECFPVKMWFRNEVYFSQNAATLFRLIFNF